MTTKSKTAWREVKLGDVCPTVFSGGTPDTRIPSYWRGNLPWLSSGETSQTYITATEKHISEEGVENSSTREAKVGDIVIATAGQGMTRGQTSMLKMDTYINQSIIALRPNDKELDATFLFYNLRARYWELRSLSDSTSSRGSITGPLLKGLTLKFPEVSKQKEIGKILSAFDEKIENNNRIIKTLEEMAQAIFKEWFLLSGAEGSLKKISEIAKLNRGVSYRSSEISMVGEGVPMINLANFLRGGGFNAHGTKDYTGKFQEWHRVKPGQILVAMTDITSNREIVGHPARVPESLANAIISLDVCSLDTEEEYIEFLYFLLLRKDFAQLMASSATGTNVSHLSKTNIENYEFLLPDNEILNRFNKVVRPMVTQQDKLSVENQKLTATRDLLLPRLMSGQIQI